MRTNMTRSSDKEYKVRVMVGEMVYRDYLITAATSEDAFKKVKDGLWNLEIRVSVEVQGELNIVKEIIRER